MPRFIDIDGGTPIAAAAEARQALGADIYVNALEFGAVGDGSTDDTAALQAWITFITANKRKGFLPNGTYKITSPLVAPGATYGWSIVGENENYAVIKQFTDNTPILQIGSAAGSTHTVVLSGLMLTYNDPQPSSNTNAINILFTAPSGYSTTYWSSFTNLQLWSGYYAVKTDTGTRSPWGCKWDMITCYDQSGGYWDDSASYTAAIPNNTWGRMTISCTRAVGPVIKGLRGYNFSIGAIEFLNASLGPQLMTVAAGATLEIGALKLEVGDYTAAGNLFQFSSNGYTRIGSLSASLATATPSSGTLAAVSLAGVASKNHAIEIGNIALRANTLTGKCVAASGAGTQWDIGSVDLYDGWKLSDVASSTTANMVTVGSWANGRLSPEKGDADYTVTLGDPSVLQFNTAFTAQRTITLPSASDGDLFAGLYYDLIFDGAINGSNTAIIKQGATTIRTQSADKQRLRYQWRRGNTSEWVLVDVADISGSTVALGNTYSNILSQSLRANLNISGGGTITVNSSRYAKWSSRFIVVAAGRGSAFATAGAFDITCPTSGTITGVGGASDKVATADGIPFVSGNFEALYYILPLGSGITSVAANFRMVGYTTDLEIPHNWVLICVRNNDNLTYNFPNGVILHAGESFDTAKPTSQKVSVPADATTAGSPGQWAADASYIYTYTGDGTTHSWVRSATTAW